jgi:hypothetical protein
MQRVIGKPFGPGHRELNIPGWLEQPCGQTSQIGKPAVWTSANYPGSQSVGDRCRQLPFHPTGVTQSALEFTGA